MVHRLTDELEAQKKEIYNAGKLNGTLERMKNEALQDRNVSDLTLNVSLD
jgi:hypothetical protein